MERGHLEVVLEEMRGRFDLVLEGHAALDRKIDKRFDELSERVDHNTFMIETLNKKVDAIDQRLSSQIAGVDKRLGVVEKKLDTLAIDVGEHRADTEVHRPAYYVREP